MTTNSKLSEKDELMMRDWLAEFHEYWIAEGEPHPNSNKYLWLNREFFGAKFYNKGLEDGIKIAMEVQSENSEVLGE